MQLTRHLVMCKIILLKYHVFIFIFLFAKLQCHVNEDNILHVNEVKFLKIKSSLTFLTVFSTKKKFINNVHTNFGHNILKKNLFVHNSYMKMYTFYEKSNKNKLYLKCPQTFFITFLFLFWRIFITRYVYINCIINIFL